MSRADTECELDTIAMFRSAGDRHRRSTTDGKHPPPPIQFNQQSDGAFHVVVDMIWNVITASRKRCLAFLRQEINNLVCFLAFCGNNGIDVSWCGRSLVCEP